MNFPCPIPFSSLMLDLILKTKKCYISIGRLRLCKARKTKQEGNSKELENAAIQCRSRSVTFTFSISAYRYNNRGIFIRSLAIY